MRFFGRALLCALICLSAPAMADDLSNGSYSTTDGSNTAAPPNGWPAGMFPNQVEPTARSNMGAVARFWERSNPKLSTTGSAGAYVITPSNVSYPTAYVQGEVYCAKANFTAVGNDTLNVNSLGAKPIYAITASGLAASVAGTIISGEQFCAAYDTSLNSGGGGLQIVSATYQPQSGFLKSSNNLSDLGSASTARTNLGLGTAATHPASSGGSGSPAAIVSTANPGEVVEYVDNSGQIEDSGIAVSNLTTNSSNLSGLSSAASARSNLGLGTAATQNTSAFDAAGAASTAQTNAQASSAQRSSNLSDLSSASTARSNLGLSNGATTTITASTSGPSGGGNNGDIWIQY